jgi:hypothetical protein
MGSAIQKTLMQVMGCAMLLASPLLYAEDTLQQCGQGAINAAGKQVGTATLWMQDCKQPWQAQSKRLRFDYTAKIPGWAFKKAASVILARNLSPGLWKQHKALFDQVTQAYQPIKPGDSYILAYDTAQHSMHLSLNDKQQITATGQQLDQYFLIWFGEKPFNVVLKKQLLGL